MTPEQEIDRLRGQLQNAVNHLERAKRRSHGEERDAYDKAINSANRVLYETLNTRTVQEPTIDRWPQGLKQNVEYKVFCDDKGRNKGSWLSVYVALDGDVHVSMQDWEDIPDGQPNPFPNIRIRTLFGGGKHQVTRQALLNLAWAIMIEDQESGNYKAMQEASEPQEDV